MKRERTIHRKYFFCISLIRGIVLLSLLLTLLSPYYYKWELVLDMLLIKSLPYMLLWIVWVLVMMIIFQQLKLSDRKFSFKSLLLFLGIWVLYAIVRISSFIANLAVCRATSDPSRRCGRRLLEFDMHSWSTILYALCFVALWYFIYKKVDRYLFETTEFESAVNK